MTGSTLGAFNFTENTITPASSDARASATVNSGMASLSAMVPVTAIVPVAAASARSAFTTLLKVRTKVSSPSYSASSSSNTLTVRSISPGMNDRLPLASV